MGIYKLMDLIREKAPNAIRSIQLDLLAGKTVACDAPMVIKISNFNRYNYLNQVLLQKR